MDGLHAAWAMAIAFAGSALFTGLSLGFNTIKKPEENPTDTEQDAEKNKAEDD